MSFEAGGSEILGNLVPSSPRVLDRSNKLDLSKLPGLGGSHAAVLREWEQKARPHSSVASVVTAHCAPVRCWCVACPGGTVCLSSLLCGSTWETWLCPLEMKDVPMRRDALLKGGHT